MDSKRQIYKSSEMRIWGRGMSKESWASQPWLLVVTQSWRPSWDCSWGSPGRWYRWVYGYCGTGKNRSPARNMQENWEILQCFDKRQGAWGRAALVSLCYPAPNCHVILISKGILGWLHSNFLYVDHIPSSFFLRTTAKPFRACQLLHDIYHVSHLLLPIRSTEIITTDQRPWPIFKTKTQEWNKWKTIDLKVVLSARSPSCKTMKGNGKRNYSTRAWI